MLKDVEGCSEILGFIICSSGYTVVCWCEYGDNHGCDNLKIVYRRGEEIS